MGYSCWSTINLAVVWCADGAVDFWRRLRIKRFAAPGRAVGKEVEATFFRFFYGLYFRISVPALQVTFSSIRLRPLFFPHSNGASRGWFMMLAGLGCESETELVMSQMASPVVKGARVRAP